MLPVKRCERGRVLVGLVLTNLQFFYLAQDLQAVQGHPLELVEGYLFEWRVGVHRYHLQRVPTR